MRIITHTEFAEDLARRAESGELDEQTDNSGQIVIYTNYWLWGDKTIRDLPDPSYQDDISDA